MREPRWWYRAEPSVMTRLLDGPERLYAHFAMRRMAQAPRYTSRLPVVCIGNFTAGGTGKTPLTRHIAALLRARGAVPAVLSRGYGGRTYGPHWVDLARDAFGMVGDEPMLLAQDASTLVARDRAQGAQAIETAAGGYTHIVMDDGLQNPTLAKTLAIAVVDGRRGIGNGRMLPAGPLRAPLALQMTKTDAIVVNRGFVPVDTPPTPLTVELSRTFPGPVLEAGIAPEVDTEMLLSRSWVAFAGIGAPQHFFDMLTALGATVAATRPFKDHHAFNEANAVALLALAARHGAGLITTEKDRVRLDTRANGALAELAAATITVPIRMSFSEPQALRLDALLSPVLNSRRT